ncbi:LysR family transcriptional regulator [Ruegeria sp.]|uniref:LysR family transcriptional regulator n=1 Tax=Ruegeria sp. TaxID=1879320 RepID=UPI002318F5B1|nr:LysR family transcriptional regulator [Ruegeria sp.]MDA7965355.1 LysR family transcriptional regulator [Ruegeria sp.]
MTENNAAPNCDKTIPIRDWDLIRFLLCVARAGSIARASERLSESPATVGRKLKELEEDLSLPLFDRGTSGVKLTPIGQELLAIAQNVETQLGRVGELTRSYHGMSGGTVAVAAPEGFGEAVIMPKLIEFHSFNPQIKIDLLLSNKRINMHNREADIAIRLGQPETYRIESEKLGRVRFGIYASQDYLLGLDGISTLDELAGHNVIVATGALGRSVQEIEFRKIIDRCNIAARTDSICAQLSAVRSGFGLAVLPKYMAETDPNLVEVMPGLLEVSLELWVLTHRDVVNYQHVQTTKQFIFDMCTELVDRS